jgi:hypothetical protein
MTDSQLVAFAQKIVDKDRIKNKLTLRRSDSGLDNTLSKRKDAQGIRLIDKVKFEGDGRAWSNYSDDDLVEHGQEFIDNEGIQNRVEFKRRDGGLYSALCRRIDTNGIRLVDKLEFKADERAWSKYSNLHLIYYVQIYVLWKGVKGRKELEINEPGLYKNLLRRKDNDGISLIDKIKFCSEMRVWSHYSDSELVEFAQKYIDREGISNRKELKKNEDGLYRTLCVKKDIDGVRLIDKLTFKKVRKIWTTINDSELVDYAQRYVDSEGVKTRMELNSKEPGLYSNLLQRRDNGGIRLIDKVKLEADERAWSRYSDKNLVEYALAYIEKEGIKDRNEFRIKDRGLHTALRKRKLLHFIFNDMDEILKGLAQAADAMESFGGAG